MAASTTHHDATPAAQETAQFSTFQWLVAWSALLLVLWLFNRTKAGHVLIYYSLVLCILFILVTQYTWFAGILKPFGSLAPGLIPQGAQTQATGPATSSAPSTPSAPATNGGGSAGGF